MKRRALPSKAHGHPVKVGILGAGWVATARHVPSFRQHPNVEVVAIYDRRPERAERAAAELGIPHHHGDAASFFDQDLDIVSICTPPWLHAEHAIEALGRDRHVFTEKPMAMNEGDAQAMVDAARAAGRMLCVSHNFLYSRAVRKADDLIGGGLVSYALGLQMSSVRRRLPDWYEQLPGGLLLDESPHMFYTLQHFLGPLELHSARATLNRTTGLPATAEVQVKGTAGIGQVTMLFETPLSEWHIGLVSPERTVCLDLFRDIAIPLTSDKAHKPLDILGTSAQAMLGHVGGFVTSGGRYMTHRLFWGHELIIRDFVDATLERGPVPVSPADSIGVVRLTDALLKELQLT